MELKYELENSLITLLTTTKDTYRSQNLETIKQLARNANKICYVALNMPYHSLITAFQNHQIDISKFFYIDVLTREVEEPPEADNCIFVESPSALTELSMAISDAITKKNCDMAVFDSITTLTIYRDEQSIVRFTHTIITKLRVLDKRAVFIAMKEDAQELIKDISMFVDKFIEI